MTTMLTVHAEEALTEQAGRFEHWRQSVPMRPNVFLKSYGTQRWP